MCRLRTLIIAITRLHRSQMSQPTNNSSISSESDSNFDWVDYLCPMIFSIDFPKPRPFTIPIELCELIIDLVGGTTDPLAVRQKGRDAALLACMLTSRAWVPRSQMNLYTFASFYSNDHVACFVKYLQERPPGMIKYDTVYLEGYKASISVPVSIVQLAPCGHAIRSLHIESFYRGVLGEISTDEMPPAFWASCATFRSLQKLSLDKCTVKSLHFLKRLLLSFCSLRELKLKQIQHTSGEEPRPEGNRLTSLLLHGQCPRLRSLYCRQSEDSLSVLMPWLEDTQMISTLDELDLEISKDDIPLLCALANAAGASITKLTFAFSESEDSTEDWEKGKYRSTFSWLLLLIMVALFCYVSGPFTASIRELTALTFLKLHSSRLYHLVHTIATLSSPDIQEISMLAYVYDDEETRLVDTLTKFESSLLRHSTTLRTLSVRLPIGASSEEFFTQTEGALVEACQRMAKKLQILVTILLEWYTSYRRRPDSFKKRRRWTITSKRSVVEEAESQASDAFSEINLEYCED